MLTTKQEKFVEELIKGKSQRDAYKSAFSTKGMKPRTIDSKACILFKSINIRARYFELKEESERISGENAASVRAFLVAQLKDIAEGKKADTTKMYDSKGHIVGKRTQAKQSDRISAMNKLAELYGIGAETEDKGINITIHDTEDYKH